MKKIIALLLLIYIATTYQLFSDNYTSAVYITLHQTNLKPVTNMIFGGFTEMLMGYVNGDMGIWAQELVDRGFDMDSCENHTHSCLWNEIKSSDSSELQLTVDRFNLNGIYSQKFINYSDTSYSGIAQEFLASDTIGYDFYIYTKGNGGNLLIKIESDNGIDYFEAEIGTPTNTWTKEKITIPAIKNNGRMNCKIIYKGKGECQIDEASLMQTNNFMGIRDEYYQLFKNWNMGLLRYPGGWFADSPLSHWKNGIGNIDNRLSPNYNSTQGFQKLDWGTIEFLNFCKALKITPHLTVNYQNGTPEEAAEWVEFVNGDTSTFWGKKRAELGYPEPFNVKYWEIGNEQWANASEYANRYLLYYDAMKNIDPSISCICDGDRWQGIPYFDSLFFHFDNKCEVYGYHDAIFPRMASEDSSLEYKRYLRTMAQSVIQENYLDDLNNRILQKELQENTVAANSEFAIYYGGEGNEWLLDTVKSSGSLEGGIASALWYNVYLRHPDKIRFCEKTLGIGTFKRGINKNSGRRTIYGSCSYLSTSLISNHFGENVASTAVTCDGYDQLWVGTIPWLDVTTTYSSDSIFISIINRHPSDTAIVNFQADDILFNNECIAYSLFSENYDDAVTNEYPEFITLKRNQSIFTNKMAFLPHSLTILAFKNQLGSIYPTDKKNKNFELLSNKNYIGIISKNFEGNSQISVSDINGKKIINTDYYFLKNYTLNMSLTDFQSGLYFITIKTDNSIEHFKFLIIN